MGIEKILLATDYPYEDSRECMQFLEGLPITQEAKDKIYFLNAGQIGITGSLSPNTKNDRCFGDETMGLVHE